MGNISKSTTNIFWYRKQNQFWGIIKCWRGGLSDSRHRGLGRRAWEVYWSETRIRQDSECRGSSSVRWKGWCMSSETVRIKTRRKVSWKVQCQPYAELYDLRSRVPWGPSEGLCRECNRREHALTSWLLSIHYHPHLFNFKLKDRWFSSRQHWWVCCH